MRGPDSQIAARLPDARRPLARPLARRLAQAAGTAASPNHVNGGFRAAPCLWTGRAAPCLWTGAFGLRPPRLAVPRTATPRTPHSANLGRKPLSEKPSLEAWGMPSH